MKYTCYFSTSYYTMSHFCSFFMSYNTKSFVLFFFTPYYELILSILEFTSWVPFNLCLGIFFCWNTKLYLTQNDTLLKGNYWLRTSLPLTLHTCLIPALNTSVTPTQPSTLHTHTHIHIHTVYSHTIVFCINFSKHPIFCERNNNPQKSQHCTSIC